MDITSAQVDALAPNPAAAKNGRALAEKGSLSRLGIDPGGTVLWGECAGSGSTPYFCSADFAVPLAPVFRCSCPSRQFPCKHCLGLLQAYASGQTFALGELPDALAEKREKAAKRQEKKAEAKTRPIAEAKPKKASAAALTKKIEAQLAGLAKASELLSGMAQAGLSSLDAAETASYREQVKDLGNFFIPGVQTAFSELLLAVEEVEREEFTAAVDQMTFLSALLAKATAYLGKRRENPLDPPETDSAIEEQIGRAWKLSELAALGLSETDASLMQLHFDAIDSPARREVIEEGAWFNLRNGRIYRTRNYRPYKALKYVRAENSFSQIAEIGEIFLYPGDVNPRVRWEPTGLRGRETTPEDLAVVHSHAAADYAARFKELRAVIKNPLTDKNPMTLLALHKAWRNGSDLVVEDTRGTCLTLLDAPGRETAPATMLGTFLPADCAGLSLLVRVDNDVARGLFAAQPLSLVCRDKIIRLFY